MQNEFKIAVVQKKIWTGPPGRQAAGLLVCFQQNKRFPSRSLMFRWSIPIPRCSLEDISYSQVGCRYVALLLFKHWDAQCAAEPKLCEYFIMTQHPELFIQFSEKRIHENNLESQIWRKHCKGKNFTIKNPNAGFGEIPNWVPNVISGLLGFLIG